VILENEHMFRHTTIGLKDLIAAVLTGVLLAALYASPAKAGMTEDRVFRNNKDNILQSVRDPIQRRALVADTPSRSPHVGKTSGRCARPECRRRQGPSNAGHVNAD
jgi:hypothetical protein